MDIQANNERLERILLGQAQLIGEVNELLDQEQKHDDILRASVLSSKGHRENRIERLDPERVFHVDAIRELCVKYRLRFLEAGRFKGDLPARALYELRRLEQRSAEPLRGFAAPSSTLRSSVGLVRPVPVRPCGRWCVPVCLPPARLRLWEQTRALPSSRPL